MKTDELKIATVIGARPQFIKAASISRAIAKHNSSGQSLRPIKELIVHTGQHYDDKMSKLFFDELHVPRPDYNLGVGSAPHGIQTATMLAGIEEILLREKPKLVLTYGDTNSTLAGALAAVKLHIISAHVEAGLRSHNRRMPEEINRIVADRLSNILFCPTETALLNLEREGITRNSFQLPGAFNFNSQIALDVGDVMYDSILFNEKISAEKSGILAELGLSPRGKNRNWNASMPSKVKPFCLATMHRPENTDDPDNLRSLLRALIDISNHRKVVLPLHPRTKNRLQEYDILPGNQSSSSDGGLTIIEPVGYLDMIQLEKHARVVLTDSGGVQKEAFMLGTPCITLRNETEWIETVQAGWNSLVGANTDKIKNAFFSLDGWDGENAPFFHFTSGVQDLPVNKQPYGNGKAAEKILDSLSTIICA